MYVYIFIHTSMYLYICRKIFRSNIHLITMENNLVLLMDHNYAHRLSDTSMDKNLLLNANHVTTGPQQVTEGLVTKCRKKELSRNHNSVEGHVKKKKVKRKCRNKSKEKTPTFRPDGEVDWRPLDDVILAYMSEQGVPGSSLVISYKGNVIHRKGRVPCTSINVCVGVWEYIIHQVTICIAKWHFHALKMVTLS